MSIMKTPHLASPSSVQVPLEHVTVSWCRWCGLDIAKHKYDLMWHHSMSGKAQCE